MLKKVVLISVRVKASYTPLSGSKQSNSWISMLEHRRVDYGIPFSTCIEFPSLGV